MKISKITYSFLWVIKVLLLVSCMGNTEFKEPTIVCEDTVGATITIKELFSFYEGETVQILEDWVIEGYVVSSDAAGNFFNTLHIQDNLSNPSVGLQIEVELRDAHLFFNTGQHVYIKLKGLYLGASKGVMKVGGVFVSFGNKSVGRLPKTVVFDHILRSCKNNQGIVPTAVSINDVSLDQVNTLVTINHVEFSLHEVGQAFAISQEDTKRTLVDCSDAELVLLNSGFSEFYQEPLPDGSGSITGVLGLENQEFQLRIRDLNDIDFYAERCEEVVTEFTSNQILISEIADPNNNSKARFIELYNASETPFSLHGWQLQRYTNANTEISSTVDFTNVTIGANGFLLISPNADEFTRVYGFAPDIAVGSNSPADSNGDDNFVLLDPFGAVIDVFGVIGEDGTGTNHEFEDGKAERRIDIVNGNPIFTFSEWNIFNDSGQENTINLPQNAPEDFTPGYR